jgi:hypothetical protein
MRRSHRPPSDPRRTLAALIALGLAGGLGGCAPPGPPPPFAAAPDDLAYGLPTPSPLCYAVADTARFTVDSGAMGRMSVSAAYAAVVELELGAGQDAAGQDAMEARARVHSLRGGFEPQSQPAQAVDASDLAGEFRLTLDARGRTEVLESPVLTARLLDVTSAESMVRPLFVQLPGRPAGVGDAWTDTIVSVENGPDARSTVRTVITTTILGDTVVDGRTLLRLRTRAENHMEMEGRSGGVLVRQLLTGTTEGSVLWDPHFRMLIERGETGSLAGTLAMPAAGVADVPLSATVRRHVRLLVVGQGDLDGQGDPSHCGNHEEDQR